MNYKKMLEIQGEFNRDENNLKLWVLDFLLGLK